MNTLGGSSFLQALGWAIANSLWQMALLWVGYQCVFLLFRKVKASVKTTTATLLLFGGFLWFVVSLIRHYWELDLHPVATDGEGLFLNAYSTAQVTHTDLLAYVNRFLGIGEHYLPYLSFAYLLVLVFLLVRVVKSYQHVKEVRTEGLTRIDPQWKIYIQELAYRIGIRKEVRLWLSEKIDVPATIGYLKPLILIPIASFNQLSTEQVEAILLHELAHIRRHDYLLNLVITVIETILFFNPFAQLITRHIKTERENSCDDFVLQFRYNPHAYASALLSLEKQRMAPELAMAASGKTELLNRIRRILNVPGRPMNYGQKLMAMLITAGILASLAWLTPENVENKPILSGISVLLPASEEAPAPVDYVLPSATSTSHKSTNVCCSGNSRSHCPKMDNQQEEAPMQLLSEDTIKQWENLTVRNPEMDQIAEDPMVVDPKMSFEPGSQVQIDIDSAIHLYQDYQLINKNYQVINQDYQNKVAQAAAKVEAQWRTLQIQAILDQKHAQIRSDDIQTAKARADLAQSAQVHALLARKAQDVQIRNAQLKLLAVLNTATKTMTVEQLANLQKLQLNFQFQYQLPNQEELQTVIPDQKLRDQEKRVLWEQEKSKEAKQKGEHTPQIILDFSKQKFTQDSASKVVIQILHCCKGNDDTIHVVAFNNKKVKSLKFLKFKPKDKAKVMDQDEDDVDPGIQADQPDWQAPEAPVKPIQQTYGTTVIPTAYHLTGYNTGTVNTNAGIGYKNVALKYYTPAYATAYKERVVYSKGGNTEIHNFLEKLSDEGLLPVDRNVRIVRTNGHITVNGVSFSDQLGREFKAYFQGKNFLIYTTGRVIEAYFR